MNMKQWIACILAALLLFSLCACGAQSSTAATAAPAPATAQPTVTQAPTASAAPVESPAATVTPAPTDAPMESEAPAYAGPLSPLLWKVTDAEEHTLYLFGTIHVGDERSETVLERLSPVLERCDALAVEFDVVAYAGNVRKAAEDMAQYVLTDGSTVSEHMPEDLYQRVFALLDEAGLYPALFKRYNLAMWAQLAESAMMMVSTELDAEKAMDSLLIHRAYDIGLPVQDVESSDFQMALLNSFDDALYLLQIEAVLDGADTYGDELTEMYELWLSGDRDAFWTLLASEDDAGDYSEEQLALIEDYSRRMLDERNLGMRDRALDYLASGKTVLFAVGSAHMANEAGLVRLLADAGCTVEELAY